MTTVLRPVIGPYPQYIEDKYFSDLPVINLGEWANKRLQYYAGIGSRQTPLETMAFMRFFAWTLAKEDWILRSGGAEGADSAFEEGCDDGGGEKEIFLPWQGFNKKKGFTKPETWAYEIAEKNHPAWDRLTDGGRALHARNVHQVLGWAVSGPQSEFVICWTPRGSGRGGTGQAIRIAEAYYIPIFDLGKEDAMERLCVWFARDWMLDFEVWRK